MNFTQGNQTKIKPNLYKASSLKVLNPSVFDRRNIIKMMIIRILNISPKKLLLFLDSSN